MTAGRARGGDAEAALARRVAERERRPPPPPPPKRIEGDDGTEAELFDDVPV